VSIDDAISPAADSYVRGMERLVLAVQELSLARDLEQVQHIVRTTAREMVGSDGATFVLRDDGQCYYADEDAIEPLWKGSRFPMDACISGWSMLNKQPVVIEDIYADDRIPHAAYRPTFVKSLAMVPIRSLDPIGAIGNYWADGHLATADEVKLLQALADATSVAMENVAIYHELEDRVAARTADLAQANAEILALAVTDPLTGLLNRRGFFDEAERRLEQARRDGYDCQVAFVDIDGLKTVNDQHGHRTGDEMIIGVARALRAVIGPDDLLARLGGDEFCALIAPSREDEEVVADRLKGRLDELNRLDDRSYLLAASIGVTTITELPAALIDELVRSADERMYVDKRARAAQR
jgi:diguanylate cyclase (GGDEF)-like protein